MDPRLVLQSVSIPSNTSVLFINCEIIKVIREMFVR